MLAQPFNCIFTWITGYELWERYLEKDVTSLIYGWDNKKSLGLDKLEYEQTKRETATNHRLTRDGRQLEVCDLSAFEPAFWQRPFLHKETNQPHQFGCPLQSLLSRLVSYKPEYVDQHGACFMPLSELNMPQLIFLKVRYFFVMCAERNILNDDWEAL